MGKAEIGGVFSEFFLSRAGFNLRAGSSRRNISFANDPAPVETGAQAERLPHRQMTQVSNTRAS
jgi:hypothetical protein